FSQILAEEMVLTSPTAQRVGGSLFSTGPTYAALGDVIAMIGPSPDDSPKEKKEAIETLLGDTPSCVVSLFLQNAARANCYGPSVSYSQHEFDGSSGTWPGGDLGIWTDTDSATGEACVAAQLNAQMKGAISFIDTAQFIAAGVACVANKNGLSLPSSPSSSLDLTSSMSGIVMINGSPMTVTAAQILRDTNDTSGNAVYVTTLSGTVGTKTFDIRIKHISTSSDDSTNKGKISVKVVDTNSGGSTDGASLEYEKNSSSSGKLLLKKINFNGTTGDPFVSGSNYSVDYSKLWNNNADYLLASIDPSKFTGTYAYAWQAGRMDDHSRTFNAILNESGGIVTGTAFFGYGPTMQAGAGSIQGMICAWTGPDQNHTPVSKVQRQDMVLSSGKFVVSGTTYTTYDPVADCEADTNGTTMTMAWLDGTTQDRSVSSTTENLKPLSDVSGVLTLPTEPTNVD
ncbi:MAG: hypothetical protein K0R29_1753, partial [Pseudobdellovibrio sp.]|nr:hypothetical protein [Pseudobdellovibrio sp.]